MGVSYKKLFKLMIDRDLRKNLREIKIFLNLSAMKRKNVTCVKELFNCIALMSVTSFVGLEKTFLILRLKMRKVFLQPNVWKEGLLKLTITIGLQ